MHRLGEQQHIVSLLVRTSENPQSFQLSNTIHTIGAPSILPTKLQMANFHPYSFSRVRANTRIMMKTM